MKKNPYWSKLNKKQKIDYYFQYYFSWTIAAIAVICFVAFYAYHVISKIPPDMYVVSVGNTLPDIESQNSLKDYIFENVTDINSDDEIFIDYSAISYSTEGGATEENLMHLQKYVALMGEGEPRLVIMDKSHYEAALVDEQFDGFLTDLSYLTDKHYKNFAIPVSETTLFDEQGLDFFDEYYLVLTQIGGGKKESGINLDRWNGGKQFIADILK